MENRNLQITWEEIVQIGKELYQEHGDNLDIHELVLAELKNPSLVLRENRVPLPKQPPRLARRNTNERISDGIKSACTKLLGIRKVSSSP